MEPGAGWAPHQCAEIEKVGRILGEGVRKVFQEFVGEPRRALELWLGLGVQAEAEAEGEGEGVWFEEESGEWQRTGEGRRGGRRGVEFGRAAGWGVLLEVLGMLGRLEGVGVGVGVGVGGVR